MDEQKQELTKLSDDELLEKVTTQLQQSELKLVKAEKRVRDLQRLGLYTIIICLIFWILFSFIVGLTSMSSTDMEPRLDMGDLVLYFRLEKDIRSQDVVVIQKNGKEYISRIIAGPGDTITITDNETLQINENNVVESHIYQSTPRYEGFVDYPITLGENEYFVLGDRRHGAEDSRYFGIVTRQEIKGVVITIIRRNSL